LAQCFWFGSVFSSLDSVRLFLFQAYKTEAEPVGFFKILIILLVIMLITLLLNIRDHYFRFSSIFIKKNNQNRFSGLARCFRFGSVFSDLGSVRFFQFQAYKTKTEPVGFFKILIILLVIMLITLLLNIKAHYFRFSSVFIKKNNQNRFSGLARCFRFGSVFFDLGSVRFFLFQVYKTKIEPVGFFKILIILLVIMLITLLLNIRAHYFRFNSVFIKKITKTGFLVWIGFFRFGFSSVFSVSGL